MVENRTERTWRKHVNIVRRDRIHRHCSRAEVLDAALDGRRINVRDPQLGASRMQVLREPVADVADTLDGDAQPLELVAIELVTHCRLQANEHTERRRGRRIAGAAGGAGLGVRQPADGGRDLRSEEHTSELQSLMRISYAVFCLKKKQIMVQRMISYT